ncbi:hypothetical protein BGZ83_004727 [Gryganskiella cystojenkinii]|nr:hypothetical protein BGZ83_004727 [Gryganskiella cystojenkinii]
MTSKCWCIIDGETTDDAFSVEVSPTANVSDLKRAIKATLELSTPSKGLALWKWSILPDADNGKTVVKAKDLDENANLLPKALLSSLSLDENTYIIIQLPQEFEDMPKNKIILITEQWVPYTASDGKSVDLPSSLIDILSGTKFVPEPCMAFDHLKDNLRAGDSIFMSSMGQEPKDFGLHGQQNKLFVTEQMLEIWEEMRGDKERELDGKKEDESELEVVKRFLAINNKDILTAAEFEMLVNHYDGTYNISTDTISVIFGPLLNRTGGGGNSPKGLE